MKLKDLAVMVPETLFDWDGFTAADLAAGGIDAAAGFPVSLKFARWLARTGIWPHSVDLYEITLEKCFDIKGLREMLLKAGENGRLELYLAAFNFSLLTSDDKDKIGRTVYLEGVAYDLEKLDDVLASVTIRRGEVGYLVKGFFHRPVRRRPQRADIVARDVRVATEDDYQALADDYARLKRENKAKLDSYAQGKNYGKPPPGFKYSRTANTCHTGQR